MSNELENKFNTVKQEHEISETLNHITNLKDLVLRTHKYLNVDIPLCEKIEIIQDFKKDMIYHINKLSINVDTSHNSSFLLKNKPNIFNNTNNSSNIYNKYKNNIASLWISGFSNPVTQNELFNLFSPLDNKLKIENIVLRGHYAFINFKDSSAADTAHNRCWNLNGEILETNIRYAK